MICAVRWCTQCTEGEIPWLTYCLTKPPLTEQRATSHYDSFAIR